METKGEKQRVGVSEMGRRERESERARERRVVGGGGDR